MKIAFVILNFNTFQETIECIESIKENIDTEDYAIVIVDNHSTDESLKYLHGIVDDDKKLFLLPLEKNYGFARGNNVGIKYANDHFKPDYVVVLNSDTKVIQKNLMKRIDEEYQKSTFAVLGPMIITSNGLCNNSPDTPYTLERIEDEIKTLLIERFFTFVYLHRMMYGIRFVIKTIKDKLLRLSYETKDDLLCLEHHNDVVVQGAFLIFAQKTFEFIDGFSENTFLYYEEALLYESIKEHSLEMVYTPEIIVFHKEKTSAKRAHDNERKYLLFTLDCLLDSARILRNYLAKKERNETEETDD